jgi:hypothetical protein
MASPSHCWPHQHRPWASIRQVPVPQQRSSSCMEASKFSMCLGNWPARSKFWQVPDDGVPPLGIPVVRKTCRITQQLVIHDKQRRSKNRLDGLGVV